MSKLGKKKTKSKSSITMVVILILTVITLFYIHQYSNHTSEFSWPQYNGKPYIEINSNIPYFTKEEKNIQSFETYADLDYLGRCGVAYACLSKETMPTKEREKIGMIKPSGWQTVKYPDIIDDLYLYNRCHLIAWCLSGENANEKNLITGTRYMNIEGMLPFEEKVAKYIDTSGNHVLYRATPIFEGKNLVVSGVLLEAYSVEDQGDGIQFCVYCFNVQPGIEIDYRTGKSKVKIDNYLINLE